MALTETYVDPAIAGNSGTGTIGDPYGDLQYALDTMTRDSTNGDRLNIKAGTAEVMAAAISLATYGTPTATAPLVFQGYTATAGDGGIGEISGGGSVSIMNGGQSSVHFVNMKLGNTGAQRIFSMGNYCLLLNCELTGSSASSAVLFSVVIMHRCYVHSITNSQVNASTDGRFYDCYFEGGASAACLTIAEGVVDRCNFDLSGGEIGISLAGTRPVISNNSFYANAGTGHGINWNANQGDCFNNIFSGFSGAGGEGININAGKAFLLYGNNFFYNNTANTAGTLVAAHQLPDITLTNAPFTNPGGGDFSIAAAAKAELQAQGWPSSFNGISTNQYLDPGAAQIQIPTATGGGRRSRGRYHGV